MKWRVAAPDFSNLTRREEGGYWGNNQLTSNEAQNRKRQVDIRQLKIDGALESYDGISSAWARVNFRSNGLEITLKPRAAELGMTQQLLAREIRQAFYGEEAQRVQRGIDSIRVMVRLPEKERRSLHTLEQLRIRTPRGAEIPLATVAEIEFVKAPSFVERNNGAEVIRIGGQPVDEYVDIVGISKDLAAKIEALCAEADTLFNGSVMLPKRRKLKDARF